MQCWKCGENLELPSSGRVAFKATCDMCLAWLHCCKNCVNYKPGLPNDCKIPGTEPIADREACNVCDEFVLLGQGPKTSANPNDISKRLFGEEDDSPPKSFDNLFRDS